MKYWARDIPLQRFSLSTAQRVLYLVIYLAAVFVAQTLTLSTSAVAQSAPTPLWCSSTDPNHTYNPAWCKYTTAFDACQAYAPDGTVTALWDLDVWIEKGCNTKDEHGNTSASVYFVCLNGAAAPPSRCTSTSEDFPGRAPDNPQACDSCAQPTGGRTPYPIDILNGSKLYEAKDFDSADGLLKLRRLFNSAPYGGVGNAALGAVIGLANWALDFQLEIQLNASIKNPTNLATLLTPSGGAYLFQHQAGGFVPYEPPSSPLPQTDYSLTLLDTWPTNPADLLFEVTHWKLIDAQDNVWTFQSYPDYSGHYFRVFPTQLVERSGRTITLSYDAGGVLQSIADSYGKTITFDWQTDQDGLSRVIGTARLPGGYKIQYDYNYTGANIAQSLAGEQLIDPSGAVLDSTTYKYENASFPTLVTGVVDATGVQRLSASYDTQGRATDSSEAGGVQHYHIDYSAAGNTFTRTMTNPLGKQIIFNYARTNLSIYDQHLVGTTGVATANTPATSTSIYYGPDQFVSSTVDPLTNTTGYTWDPRALPNTVTPATGTSIQRTITTHWNSTWHVPDEIDYPNVAVNFTYYSNGELKTRTETDTTTTSQPYSTNGQTRTWTYTWNTAGQPLTIQGPGGATDVISFDYDSGTGYIKKITNQLNQNTVVTAWNWRGDPTTITDANGISSNLTYDAYGRILTATIRPGPTQAVYQFDYTAVGDVWHATLPDGLMLTYGYDDARRLRSITNNLGESISYDYDSMDDRKSTIIKSSTGVVTKQESATFDELGRLLTNVGAASQTTTHRYDLDDNEIETDDPRNMIYRHDFDALNRLYKETDPDMFQTVIGFNGDDQVTSVQDARTLVTSYVRDGFGDIIQQTSPDSGKTIFWYDSSGNLTKKKDARGVVTDYTYDVLNRIKTRKIHGTTAENVTFTYDVTSSSTYGIGRLSKISDPSGSTAFGYDAFGGVTSESRTIQGNTFNITFLNNPLGNPTSVTYPSGRIVFYSRDALGRISGVTTKENSSASAVTIASTVAYEPFGPINGLTFGNGIVATFSHDQDYQLHTIHAASGSATIQDLLYDYDPAGNVHSITDNSVPPRSQSFGYDDLNRLQTAGGAYGTQGYTYDGSGNRTQKSGGTSVHYAIAPDSNRLNSTLTPPADLRTFSYLDSGQLSQDQDSSAGRTLGYNYTGTGRLASATLNGNPLASYLVNGLEQRVSKTVGSTTTDFIFDRLGHLLAEADGATGTTTKEYIWAADLPVAMVDRTGASPVIYYIHTDHLGTPQKLTDGAMNAVWDGQFDPFGNATSIAGSVTMNLRFPGQYFDAETGLSQNWNRDYDSTVGRYIQSDPIGQIDHQSTYAYVLNNPLWDDDPSGLAGRKGERGYTGNPGRTDYPSKGWKDDPDQPGWGWQKDPQTGKKTHKKRPPYIDKPTKGKKNKMSTCPNCVGGALIGGVCIIGLACILQPELCLPVLGGAAAGGVISQ